MSATGLRAIRWLGRRTWRSVGQTMVGATGQPRGRARLRGRARWQMRPPLGLILRGQMIGQILGLALAVGIIRQGREQRCCPCLPGWPPMPAICLGGLCRTMAPVSSGRSSRPECLYCSLCRRLRCCKAGASIQCQDRMAQTSVAGKASAMLVHALWAPNSHTASPCKGKA